MDGEYTLRSVDYEWLNNSDSSGVFFVTRLKLNADIQVVEKFLTDEKHQHILSDQDISLIINPDNKLIFGYGMIVLFLHP